MFCKSCGTELKDDARFCPSCGTTTNFTPITVAQPEPAEPVKVQKAENKKKKTASLLGIFLGGIGLHRFYLGYTGTALIHIMLFLVGFLTFGVCALASYIWAIVDVVRILRGKIAVDANDVELI